MTPNIFEQVLMGGSLHSHHIHQNSWGQKPPHLVALDRGGSNCAEVELSDKLNFHFNYLDSRFIGMADHVRDGQLQKSRAKVEQLFVQMMQDHSEWCIELFGRPFDAMNHIQQTAVHAYAHGAADTLIIYGDERIWGNWDRIDELRPGYPNKRIFSGGEFNLMPNGEIDVPLHADSRCELFVMSLHPNIDEQGFAEMRSDPLSYGQFLMEAVERHRPHILAHPGYSCKLPGIGESDPETPFRRDMEWRRVGGRLVLTGTALEINYSRVWYQACKELVNPNKHPAGSQQWKIDAVELFEVTPLLNDPDVMAKLVGWINNGLLFVINGDEHHIPIANAVPGRFDQIMAMYASWMNQRLAEYGIVADQVINTWPTDKLELFLAAR